MLVHTKLPNTKQPQVKHAALAALIEASKTSKPSHEHSEAENLNYLKNSINNIQLSSGSGFGKKKIRTFKL